MESRRVVKKFRRQNVARANAGGATDGNIELETIRTQHEEAIQKLRDEHQTEMAQLIEEQASTLSEMQDFLSDIKARTASQLNGSAAKVTRVLPVSSFR